MSKSDNLSRIEEFFERAPKITVNRRDFLKSLTVLSGLLAFLGQAKNAYAHPPSDIKITFDAKTRILQAVLVHNVSNPLKHYIKKVDVALNGKEIIEHNISRQDNNNIQTVSYLVPDVKDADKLSVEGYCNISGKLKKEITVRFEK